jgi:type VI secretion system protein ImpF
MARNPGDVTVTLSVLDRLLDNEPGSQVESPLSRAQSVRLLKNAVRRDLEWLLNTRRIFQEPDERLKEVNRSVYVYGLPDVSGFTMASPSDQARLLRSLVATIKLFEPRLGNVRIVPIESAATGIQEFRLRIEALLLMDPSPEPISFDTVIELKSGACRLSGGAHAG